MPLFGRSKKCQESRILIPGSCSESYTYMKLLIGWMTEGISVLCPGGLSTSGVNPGTLSTTKGQSLKLWDQMARHHFTSEHRQVGPPIDYSTDAIIYVTVVVVFYAAIIILLLTTNFRRKRPNSTNSNSRHGESSPNTRKHWLFFNPVSGEAQQATKKESQQFIHSQDAETV